MSQAQIELSPAELDLIEARRTEEAAKAETKRLEEEAKEAKAQRLADAEKAKTAALVAALRKVDTKDLLFQPEIGSKICFMLDGREEEIEIVEHRVYGSGSWRASNRGLKYRLRGNYNNYNERYYTNPKTVIKKIVEFQELVQSRNEIAQSKASASEIALKHMTEKYPTATVTFEKGYDYRGNRRHNPRDYAPDRIKVLTPNGHIEFTYRIDSETNVIETSVRSRSIGSTITDKVNALILG